MTALAGCEATGGFDGLDSGSDDPRRSVIETYDAALVERNNATEARDAGINMFNAEEYGEATSSFETALEGYEDAEAGFAEAANRAAEIGRDDAHAICETARDETRLQIEATEAALAAATAAEEGADESTINGHVEEFRDIETQANALTVEDTEVLVKALGVQ